MNWTSFATPAIGASGLLALGVLLIYFGKLVPSTTVDRVTAAKDEEIKLWKAAYDRSEAAHVIKDRQIAALMDAGRTTTHVLQAMHQAALTPGGSGHEVATSDEG